MTLCIKVFLLQNILAYVLITGLLLRAVAVRWAAVLRESESKANGLLVKLLMALALLSSIPLLAFSLDEMAALLMVAGSSVEGV